MRKLPYNILILLSLLNLTMLFGQEYKKKPSSYNLVNNAEIVLNTSFLELEIEEWDKNKLEIEQVLHAEGLPSEEAKALLEEWHVDLDQQGKQFIVTSNADIFSSEYFFMDSDKIIGNIEIPEIEILDLKMDSLMVVMPKFEDFPDIDFEFDTDSLAFDFDKFENDEDYLKEWQVKIKENLKHAEKNIQYSVNVLESEEFKAKLKEANRFAKEHAKMAAKNRKILEKHEKMMKKHEKEINEKVRAHEVKIQKILEDRESKKVTRVLKIKVPKSANLKLNVDYCKIRMIK